MTKLLSLIVVLGAGQAFATVNLLPGETRYVTNDYVTCGGQVGPGPAPQPLPPPPPPTTEVPVSINYPCLEAIAPTDGRSITNAAAACASSAARRQTARLRNCVFVTSYSTDYRLADSIINKSTSIIYERQKESVRESSSVRVFRCEY